MERLYTDEPPPSTAEFAPADLVERILSVEWTPADAGWVAVSALVAGLACCLLRACYDFVASCCPRRGPCGHLRQCWRDCADRLQDGSHASGLRYDAFGLSMNRRSTVSSRQQTWDNARRPRGYASKYRKVAPETDADGDAAVPMSLTLECDVVGTRAASRATVATMARDHVQGDIDWRSQHTQTPDRRCTCAALIYLLLAALAALALTILLSALLGLSLIHI